MKKHILSILLDTKGVDFLTGGKEGFIRRNINPETIYLSSLSETTLGGKSPRHLKLQEESGEHGQNIKTN